MWYANYELARAWIYLFMHSLETIGLQMSSSLTLHLILFIKLSLSHVSTYVVCLHVCVGSYVWGYMCMCWLGFVSLTQALVIWGQETLRKTPPSDWPGGKYVWALSWLMITMECPAHCGYASLDRKPPSVMDCDPALQSKEILFSQVVFGCGFYNCPKKQTKTRCEVDMDFCQSLFNILQGRVSYWAQRSLIWWVTLARLLWKSPVSDFQRNSYVISKRHFCRLSAYYTCQFTPSTSGDTVSFLSVSQQLLCGPR